MSAFRLNIDNIYQITIGSDPKGGFTWKVGQGVNGSKYIISRIIRHEDSFLLHGEVMYVVYAKAPGDDDYDFIWRAYSNVPVSLLCDINKQYEDVRD
jgi:hypothetical protein